MITQEEADKTIERLHEILWHFPIGSYNWNRVVKVILSLVGEHETFVYKDKIHPGTKRIEVPGLGVFVKEEK